MSTINILKQKRILLNDFTFLLNAALDAIEPASLINRIVRITKNETNEKDDYMQISNRYLFKNQQIDGGISVNDHKQYELKRNVYVASFGKAALGISCCFIVFFSTF
jgi:hypothetical protein